MSCSRSRNHSLSDDVDDLAIAAHRELDLTVRECEQRVVLADAHVLARVEVGATLANQNVASHDGFAAELLHTEVLEIRIATVARAGSALLMCHFSFLSVS